MNRIHASRNVRAKLETRLRVLLEINMLKRWKSAFCSVIIAFVSLSAALLSHGQIAPGEIQQPSSAVSARPAWERDSESATHQILRPASYRQVAVAPALQVGSRGVYVVVPDTDISNPSQRESLLMSAPEEVTDASKVVAHTNYLVLAGPGVKPQVATAMPAGENPDSLRNIYHIPSAGGSKAIALVDAFDYATAEADLAVFSTQFGLKQCGTADGCLKIVYQGGTKPGANCDWAGETALDLQWAHAMAPGWCPARS